MHQNLFQKTVNEVINNPAPRHFLGHNFVTEFAKKFDLKTRMSCRVVFYTEGSPFVIKMDRDSIPDPAYLQNKVEFDFYQKVCREAPQFRHLLPKIYWISSCTRFMFVEHIPREVQKEELSGILYKEVKFLEWVEENTTMKIRELTKLSSWRKDAKGRHRLVDSGINESNW